MAKLAIIGTGLMGTSLALALKGANVRELEVVGTDSDRRARNGAQKTGAFDRIEGHLASAVRDANLVVLATPVMAMKELMEVIGPELREGCVVTDMGSSKKVVLDWAEQYLPRHVDFVGGHPMAGKETSGPENADGSLFDNKVYCVIPSPRAQKAAVSEVTALAKAIGAQPFYIGVDEHDSFVAAASHLPFLLSVALVGCTSKSVNWEDIAQLAASGFGDISRLASGDPIMHRDICASNPEPIVAWIDAYIRELYQVRQMLTNENGPDIEAIQEFFEQAAEARARWLAGDVIPMSTQSQIQSDLPSFSESMGTMFMGTRGLDVAKRMTRGEVDRDRR
jgi:prephenate dehydrogenase